MKTETYQDIGELLRHNRERHGLEVQNVARALHIRAKYLIALEEGRIQDLPGVAYARGYVVNYAAYLGLDKDEVAVLFDAIGVSQPRSFFTLPDAMNGKEQKPTRQMIWLSLLAALVVFMLWSLATRPPSLAGKEQETASVMYADRQMPGMTASGAPAHPCFTESASVYPPCTFEEAAWTGLLRRVESVVELREAQFKKKKK